MQAGLGQLEVGHSSAKDTGKEGHSSRHLAKEGCKVQSLTTSDQHATLLLSHTEVIQQPDENNEDEVSNATSSLLKLTLVPFHKALLGSNPVVSQEDIDKGQFPERNLLQHDPKASEEIISFLQRYNFSLTSESGAEYSYYEARPNSDAKLATDAATEHDNCTESFASAAAFKLGSFDVELITPASARQVSRAMPSLGHVLVHETPEMYNTVVKPYIQSIVDSGSLSWITNIIELKKEKERLLANDDNFIVNVDTKWRTHPPPLTTPRKEWYKHPSTVDLYCLGIAKQSDIACLRDLRGEHIPLLNEMERKGLSAIKEVYGVEEDQIRVFIHYHPQFYHFHVHFTRLENETGCSVERGHLLPDVVQNLEMDPEYYCKRTITYKLKKGTPLQSLIEQHLRGE
ncbi:hypothetical protein ACHAXT_005321 [Thalassiosira profunda]